MPDAHTFLPFAPLASDRPSAKRVGEYASVAVQGQLAGQEASYEGAFALIFRITGGAAELERTQGSEPRCRMRAQSAGTGVPAGAIGAGP